MLRYLFIFIILTLQNAYSEGREIRIGVIASLTGFAAQYGQAVVDGIKSAQPNVGDQVRVRLFIEDDQSQVSKALSAYRKLRSIDKIDALIGGSWWANGIVKVVERDGIPFISCETMYDKDFIEAKNYFSLAGDLRDWARAFKPLIERSNWRSSVMIRFASGFADTLDSEFKEIFKLLKRELFPSVIYSDLEMTGVSSLVLKALNLKPDAIFIDSQPVSFANFMRELQKLKASTVVLSHTVAEDAIRGGLINTAGLSGKLFFLRRSSYSPSFQQRFEQRIGYPPKLNADLGYYAYRLITSAFESGGDPLMAIKEGLTVDGLRFNFDQHNVSHSVVHEVYGIDHTGAITKADG
jgi:ABC-type branched-subunit amino acid transport system substrate-binding protein